MAAENDWAEICKDQFSRFDVDGSGYIEQRELHNVFMKLSEDWSWERSKLLFEAMDANADGYVDYEELIDWVAGVADHEEIHVPTLDHTLSALRQLAERWEAQIGKSLGSRRAISGDFPAESLEQVAQVTLTVITLSGQQVQLSDLQHDQPLGDVFALVAKAFDRAPNTFSLLLKDQSLGPRDAKTSLASLGISGGSATLTCVVSSLAVLADGGIDDYELLDAINECDFCGYDKLARHKLMGSFYSLRILPKSFLCRVRQVPRAYQEKAVLQSVRHPFITELYASFQDPLNLYLVIEHAPGGELLTHLKLNRRFPHGTTKFYLAIVVLAIEYLHSQNVMFRQLKPENLLITQDGYLKLRDFCASKRLESGHRTYTAACAPEYAPPEVLLNEGQDHAVDIWAFGVLAYELSVGQPPFTDEQTQTIYLKILACKMYFPKYVKKPLRHIIKSCLTKSTENRWAIDAVRSSSLFEDMDWTLLCDSQLPAPWVPELEGDDDLRYFSKIETPEPRAEQALNGSDPFASW